MNPTDQQPVWFIANQLSHIGRFLPMIDAIETRLQVPALFVSVDHAVMPRHRVRTQLLETARPVIDFPKTRYRPTPSRFIQSFYGRYLIARATEFLKTHRPRAIVFSAGGLAVNSAIAQSARRLGIPTILIPDGLTPAANPRYRSRHPILLSGYNAIRAAWFRLMPVGSPRGNSRVDRILVISTGCKEAQALRGDPPERLFVIGAPQYDGLFNSREQLIKRPSNELYEALSLPPDRPIALFAHQFSITRPYTQQAVTEMARAASDHNACLVVKLHPTSLDQPGQWSQWARSRGFSNDHLRFVKNETSILDLLRCCRVVITAYSTVALEAMILHRPILKLSCLNQVFTLNYAQQYHAALEVFDMQQLRAELGRLLTDDDLCRQLNQAADRAIASELPTDGTNATERFLHHFCDVVGLAI